MRTCHLFRHIAVIVLAMTLAAALAGCRAAPSSAGDPPADTPIDTPDLQQLNELFAPGGWYSQALTSTYEDPRDVDLCQMFYNGGSRQPTQEEYDDIQQQLDFPGTDIMVISRQEMEDALNEVFGLTLEETAQNGLDHFIFREDTDCYYLCHGDTNVMSVTFTSVQEQEDHTLLLTYEGADGACCVTLQPDTAADGTETFRIVRHVRAD